MYFGLASAARKLLTKPNMNGDDSESDDYVHAKDSDDELFLMRDDYDGQDDAFCLRRGSQSDDLGYFEEEHFLVNDSEPMELERVSISHEVCSVFTIISTTIGQC